jgi:hypothetical protein
MLLVYGIGIIMSTLAAIIASQRYRDPSPSSVKPFRWTFGQIFGSNTDQH